MKTNRYQPDAHLPAEKRRGTTMVEFAMVSSILFLFLMAGFEFAILSTIRATAHNAAYEAARKLVIPGAVAAEGIDEATRIMAIVGVDTLTVTVTPSTITESTKQVTVDVSVPYASNAVFVPFFTGHIVLDSSITMATERYDGIIATP